MGLFSFLTGKSPEDIETKGDQYFDQDRFGYAKIEYEKAKERHMKKPSADHQFDARINEKIQNACEGLAKEHFAKANEYVELNCVADAASLADLALNLTKDSTLTSDIMTLKEQIESGKGKKHNGIPSSEKDQLSGEMDIDGGEHVDSVHDSDEIIDETFFAICSTLDESEQEAYATYGDAFKKGYVALNEGEFQTARHHLLEALEMNLDNNHPNHISMELALCCLNMGDYEDSKRYAKMYLNDFPGSEKGARIMCETFWAEEDYQGAEAFLNQFLSIPVVNVNDERVEGTAVDDGTDRDGITQNLNLETTIIPFLLLGETYYQSGDYSRAEAHYLRLLQRNEDESVPSAHDGKKQAPSACEKRDRQEIKELLLRSLARTYQAMASYEKAMDIYGGLMQQCSGCGRMPDFPLRHGFAESGFAAGVRTTELVEIYLKLVQEDPENRDGYYRRVADIYAHQGHGEESDRFKAMAQEG